jgi:hypothetical protein
MPVFTYKYYGVFVHARTVEPEKQPLLSNKRTQQENNGVMRTVSKQWLGKHALRRKHSLYCLGDVFTEPLPSNESVRHIKITKAERTSGQEQSLLLLRFVKKVW